MQKPWFSAESLQDPGGKAGVVQRRLSKLRQGRSGARSSEEGDSPPSHSVCPTQGTQEGAKDPFSNQKPPAQPKGPHVELQGAWAPQPRVR